uniref:Methyltransferase domain-containing protein n=1 Tax=Candidatus Kentrum sp. LPFa TaxID=2126335 RepID=A0A450WVY8_9GAMM|nr:MAG: Methyltransferase domain-containing protein [Candidatus Kentron sp. LPFa]VFK34636.1 MAG: Methyltransferase domain-containing protein [Candidatus Kentron sp. LPFa]
MSQSWKEVWAKRKLDPSRDTVLAQLLAADGLDTGFGSVREESWRDFVVRTASALELGPEEEIFDLGCGAGAFLYPLYEKGHQIGGLDQSDALIRYAREAMPEGSFVCGDAVDLDSEERWDVVVSCGVFLYFLDLRYAQRVIEQMVKKARKCVAILDVPDLSTKEAAMAYRRGTLGETEYEERYRGLDHLFYERKWIMRQFKALGCRNVYTIDQKIEGYPNAQFRFNAFAKVG